MGVPKEKEFTLELVKGVEGPSVYLNNYRIAGPKPWGGGKTLHSFKVKASDIQSSGILAANDEIAALTAQVAELKREGKPADHALVDKYRRAGTGIFKFPDDVAAIIRKLDAAEAEAAALTAQNREMALDVLASSGQAQEAYAAQLAAEAERDALRDRVALLEGALGNNKEKQP